MDMDDLQIFLSICLGIGLSAACGFRIFVPLLCLSIASLTGYVQLDSSFAWIGTTPALIAFAVATVVEIGAYYIPLVDNFLDSIAVPVAGAAGICVAALVMTDVDPFWRWTLAIIAGGGMATSTQLATTKLRLLSTTTTAGLGNPVLATIEAIVAAILSVVAVLWPLAALILALVLLAACWLIIYSIGKPLLRLFRRNPPATAAPSSR
jgi:Domain of unknown function (DUF4126)